jgi:hypothetical protein
MPQAVAGRALDRAGLDHCPADRRWPDRVEHTASQSARGLETVPARSLESLDNPNGAARAGGFSLHAGIDIAPNQRPRLERLCRYMSRPPVSVDRLALASSGHVRYQLKTPYRNGTTHVLIEPLNFLARLTALVPPPRTADRPSMTAA